MLEYETFYEQLNDEQRQIVDTIVSDISELGPELCFTRPRAYFIDAPGGTGKTFAT